MVESLTIAGTLKALNKPFNDIYELGKAKAKTHLLEFRNEAFLRSIAKRVRRIEKVKTFRSGNKDVDIGSFYYPPKVILDDSQPIAVPDLAHLPPGHNYVIEGTVGQGKSIFMRHLASQELRRADQSRIPIFAEFRFLQAGDSFESFLLGAFAASGLDASSDLLSVYAESGRIVLFLDAFDEIDPDLVTPTVHDLEKLQGMHPNMQIVISARPKSGIQNSAGFRVVQLAPLTKDDHRPFIKLLTKDKDETANILKAISKSSTKVDGLLTTPLLLTLIVMLYSARQHIPDSVPEFYGELFDVLFYKHDRGKSGGFKRKRHVEIPEQKVKELFEGICFNSSVRQYRSFKGEQFTECFKNASRNTSVEVDINKLREELVKTACLLKEEGAELSFIHKSVQEFYAAAFVARSADAFAERFYSVVAQEPTQNQGIWGQTLAFLSEIDEWRYGKFFWLPMAEKVADATSLTAQEFFDSKRGLTDDEFTKLTNEVQAGAFYHFEDRAEALRTAPVVRWQGAFSMTRKPGFSGYSPFYPIVAATVLPINNSMSDKLAPLEEAIGEAIRCFAKEKSNPEKIDTTTITFEGMEVVIMNFHAKSFFFNIGVHPLLTYLDEVEEGKACAVNEIRELSKERQRLMRIIAAEGEKASLLELIS